MKIFVDVPKPVKLKAGKHIASKNGFVFERFVVKGEEVAVSQAFLDEHKSKFDTDFTSSWLIPVGKPSAQASLV